MSDETGRPRGGLRVLLIPENSEEETRSFRLSHSGVRLAVGLAITFGVVILALAGSWILLARRASLVGGLQDRVEFLEEREDRIVGLMGRLEEAEARYEQIRLMLGADSAGPASDLWLPPAGSASLGDGPSESRSPPSNWPLAERGFITQRPLLGEEGEHQGLDIAVPTNSYIRAAGAGEVVEVGSDAVYGRYVVLDHGDGYRSLYAHASETLVEVGQEVRSNEVIALSGSTGRSTAPHLHFEIHRDGQPVDPLTLVTQP